MSNPQLPVARPEEIEVEAPSRKHPLTEASRWKQMPLACRTCGRKDSEPYSILRDADGTNYCLHEACAGDRSRRVSERLPYPCTYCHDNEPGPYFMDDVLMEDGGTLTRACCHVACFRRAARQRRFVASGNESPRWNRG